MNHRSVISSEPRRRRLGMFYEELKVGDAWRTEGFTVSMDAVIGFAAEWDRQPFHVDQEASKQSIFGELVGSGLQTLMLSYRLYHGLALLDGTALAGLGIDRIRFLAPLVPGDTIHVVITAAECRPTSRPERGIVVWNFETVNQAGKSLMTLSLTALVLRKLAQGNSEFRQSSVP